MAFGLFFNEGDARFQLMQIAGDGRIRLAGLGGRPMWCHPPKGVKWEIEITDRGQTYPTRADAERVGQNLTFTAVMAD